MWRNGSSGYPSIVGSFLSPPARTHPSPRGSALELVCELVPSANRFLAFRHEFDLEQVVLWLYPPKQMDELRDLVFGLPKLDRRPLLPSDVRVMMVLVDDPFGAREP